MIPTNKSISMVLFLFLVLFLPLVMSCDDDSDTADPDLNEIPDGDDGDSCNIEDDDLTELDNIAVVCGNWQETENPVVVEKVYGTSREAVNGERFKITGTYDFTVVKKGKIEPVVWCQVGASYQKCSYPVEDDQWTGSYDVRVLVTDCNDQTNKNKLYLNIWQASSNVNKNVCIIYLDGSGPDDDDDDDDNDDNDDNDNDNDNNDNDDDTV